MLLLLFCCLKKNLSTPLHLAATYGFLEITKVLVLSGAQVDSRDLEQRTPMHMYWKYFYWKIIMHCYSIYFDIMYYRVFQFHKKTATHFWS